MIVDRIENISKYSAIPNKVIDFIKTLNSETPEGHYEIEDGIYANVDIYEPKSVENCKFEAHKKYIDIQIILDGEEKIECINIKGLEILENYDEKRDVMFFKNPAKTPDSVILLPSKFIFIYPYEAHKPQIKTKSQKVKKVVVKIKI